MSDLNLFAKPFIPKRKSYTEEDFEALQKELDEEKQKRNEYSSLLQQFKTYVESVEKMKQEYTKQYDVMIIKNSALSDVRDVLYQQITDLHVTIEQLKAQMKEDKNILDKVNIMLDEEKNKYIQKETELNQLKHSILLFNQQQTQNSGSYYPYYYYPYSPQMM